MRFTKLLFYIISRFFFFLSENLLYLLILTYKNQINPNWMVLKGPTKKTTKNIFCCQILFFGFRFVDKNSRKIEDFRYHFFLHNIPYFMNKYYLPKYLGMNIFLDILPKESTYSDPKIFKTGSKRKRRLNVYSCERVNDPYFFSKQSQTIVVCSNFKHIRAAISNLQ